MGISRFDRWGSPLSGNLATRKAPAPLRGTKAALTRADPVLRGPPLKDTLETGAILTRKPPPAGANSAVLPERPRHQKALAQLIGNRPLEGRWLASLSPPEQEQYLDLQDILLHRSGMKGEDGNAIGDPVAALSLQALLLTGRLPGSKDFFAEADLLAHLSRLESSPLAEPLDVAKLLAEVIQELAVPSCVFQGTKNTCVPTAVTLELIRRCPAEYVRLVSGLAGPAGYVWLASGECLARKDECLTDDGSYRTDSLRLLLPALMEVADGDWDYRNAEDLHFSQGQPQHVGLRVGQADGLLKSVFARAFSYCQEGDHDPAELAARLVREANPERIVLVGLEFEPMNHKYVLIGAHQHRAKQWVDLLNPSGQEESWPLELFAAHLCNVNEEVIE